MIMALVVVRPVVVVALMHTMAALIASYITTAAARCPGSIRPLVYVPGMNGFVVGHYGLLRMPVLPDVDCPTPSPTMVKRQRFSEGSLMNIGQAASASGVSANPLSREHRPHPALDPP